MIILLNWQQYKPVKKKIVQSCIHFYSALSTQHSIGLKPLTTIVECSYFAISITVQNMSSSFYESKQFSPDHAYTFDRAYQYHANVIQSYGNEGKNTRKLCILISSKWLINSHMTDKNYCWSSWSSSLSQKLPKENKST